MATLAEENRLFQRDASRFLLPVMFTLAFHTLFGLLQKLLNAAQTLGGGEDRSVRPRTDVAVKFWRVLTNLFAVQACRPLKLVLWLFL